jgi:triosephosphate isomerase
MGHVVAPEARPLIGTSWKMNLTNAEARSWLRELLEHDRWGTRTVFVLPPFTAIDVACHELAGSGILHGAQNVHHEDRGAYTGEISAPMLAALDCRIVEVGHSERRRYQGEDDMLIGLKVAAILRHGMWPLVCVGESGPQRDAARSGEVVAGQLDLILGRLSDEDARNILVAYEPWWAIGAGAIAAPLEHVARLHGLIHGWLSRHWAAGAQVPVLYGGSVDEANASSLLATPGVDGLFVGRAALDARVFARIAVAGLESD